MEAPNRISHWQPRDRLRLESVREAVEKASTAKATTEEATTEEATTEKATTGKQPPRSSEDAKMRLQTNCVTNGK